MDKIDTWIENRFGTKNTFNRQLLDNFIEFLEKELGFAWKTDNQKEYLRGVVWATKIADGALDEVFKTHEKELEEAKKQSDKRVKKVFRQTVKALERRYMGYVRKDPDQNLPIIRYNKLENWERCHQTQQDMLSEHWVKVKEEV